MKPVTAVNLFISLLILLSSVASAGPASDGPPLVRHDISVRLFPDEQRFTAEDIITPPTGMKSVKFALHSGLAPVSASSGVVIRHVEGGGQAELYLADLPEGVSSFKVAYGGVIHHPIEQVGKEQARGYSHTPGIISKDGVYLGGSSLWYPVIGDGLVTFDLRVDLPAGWDAVSQGSRRLHERSDEKTAVIWTSSEPQEEIYLVAARFKERQRPAGRISAMVFLREDDRALAEKYLDATARYLALYEKLIGPYPYDKFALVENFWETGFGMPSFTLLGPKVVRLPFIINTSYPHEILHSYWGNSVFPDYGRGNWSEGLTAYLSDHLIKEQQSGGGMEYRQSTLQKYADYVASEKDFPLTAFRSRHSSSSEAIGYGKSLMLFHMLRLDIGDEPFILGLQDFYRKKKFRSAAFEDLKESFSSVSGRTLDAFFKQWVERTGAPSLNLGPVSNERAGEGFELSFSLEQTQAGQPFMLSVPFAVTVEGRKEAIQRSLEMNGRVENVVMRLPSRALRIDIDPEFDIFRRLDPEELPPAISLPLGAKKMIVIVPASAGERMKEAYLELGRSLAGSGPDNVVIMQDTELEMLPDDAAVAVLGWENRFFSDALSAFEGYDLRLSRDRIRVGVSTLPAKDHSAVFTARRGGKGGQGVMLIVTDRHESLKGLGRKLPHYHKYSYLVFEGEEPANVAKGRWPVLQSPMTSFVPGPSGEIIPAEIGVLAQRRPLAEMPQSLSKEEMLRTVRYLSGEELGGRGLGTEGLEKAAAYIENAFRSAGLRPYDKKGGYYQIWEEKVKDQNLPVKMKNVIGVLPGKKKGCVVVGAHYDHLGMAGPDVISQNIGRPHPGADDNASGVAVLIELANVLGKSLSPERDIIFAAFTAEESGRTGSKRFISEGLAGQCIGMINIDTVGRLGRKKLLVLGAGSAREWPHIFRGAGFVTGVEVETVSEELDSSDHKSFHDAGIPAVQLFSGPHPDYHRPSDTQDRIDPEGLLKAASVAKEAIEYLAGREGPLTSQSAPSVSEGEGRKRKVSLGIIPDFGYAGNGCRITGVMPGSPAEGAGMKEGDIIIRLAGSEVSGLKGLSDVSKSLSPGQRVTVGYIREGRELSSEVVLQER